MGNVALLAEKYVKTPELQWFKTSFPHPWPLEQIKSTRVNRSETAACRVAGMAVATRNGSR